VFEVEFHGTTPNRRRKSGVDLVGPRLIALHRDGTADQLHLLAPTGLDP
jgi:hypothetical protein